MRKTAILLALACAFARADYGPGTTDSDLLRSGTPVVTNAWLAVSNETVRIARSVAGDAGAITDGTNRIDAARNVWQSYSGRVCTNADESWVYVVTGQTYTAEQMADLFGDGDEVYSRTLKWDDGSFINWQGEITEFEGWYVMDGSGAAPVGYDYSTGVIPDYATDRFLAEVSYYAEPVIKAFRGTFESGTNYVGRLALTNDIPSVVDADFTPATNYANTVARSATNYANAAVASLAQTGTVWRALSVGDATRWTDATGCVWEVSDAFTPWQYEKNELELGLPVWRGEAWYVDIPNNPSEILSQDANATWLMYAPAAAETIWYRNIVPNGQTNLVGRVALTNDIPDVSGYATQQQATNAATAVADAKISTNNAAFVEAVTNCPVVIASGGGGGDGFPAGDWSDYGTLGALLAAIIAAITWLKNNQRYALHTVTLTNGAGTLLDRAGNLVVVSGDTTLTLPAAVPGYLRDFLVRLEISGSTVPTITFSPDGNESVTYETDGDEFPVPDEAGTWSYSFTENCAAHTFAVSLKKVNTVAQGGV